MARAPKLLRQEGTPMEKCFFHFIPYQQLPDDFEKDYHSVQVDTPDLSATGKFPLAHPRPGTEASRLPHQGAGAHLVGRQ